MQTVIQKRVSGGALKQNFVILSYEICIKNKIMNTKHAVFGAQGGGDRPPPSGSALVDVGIVFFKSDPVYTLVYTRAKSG